MDWLILLPVYTNMDYTLICVNCIMVYWNTLFIPNLQLETKWHVQTQVAGRWVKEGSCTQSGLGSMDKQHQDLLGVCQKCEFSGQLRPIESDFWDWSSEMCVAISFLGVPCAQWSLWSTQLGQESCEICGMLSPLLLLLHQALTWAKWEDSCRREITELFSESFV